MLDTRMNEAVAGRKAARRLFCTALFLICALYIAFPPPAYAYVDPSVMTYTIQALAGVAVALGAVAGVAFRRTRKTIMRLLNIDENARKEVEPDVHRVGAFETSAVGVDVSQMQPGKGSGAVKYAKKNARPDGKPLTWPKRLAVSAVAAAFLVYTIFVVAPFEIVAGSSSSLVFGLADIWAPVAFAAVALTVCLALLLSVFRGKGFDVVVALTVAVGVCAYIQAMFFNSSLPMADGAAVVWDDYTTITLVSAALWIAVIVAFVGFAIYRGRMCRSFSLVACLSLVLVQSVALVSLFLAPQTASATTTGKPVVVTEEGLNSVSSKDNIIVFILDKFDEFELERLIDENPDLLDPFTGFTYFPDSTGSFIPTMFALPYLVTGEIPQDGEDFSSYVSERCSRSTYVEDLVEQGYSVGIYSDSLAQGDIDELAGDTANIHPLGENVSAVDPEGTVKILYQCALYRDLPWAFKSPFWFYTDDVNNAMVARGADSDAAMTPYTMNDLRYYDNLSSNGLKVEGNDNAGNFRMIHLQGSHEPYVMDANCQPAASGESTRGEQSIGALGIVEEYISQLKENGLYENSTIIVTADHGDWYVTMDPITEPTGPMMLVKPAGSREDSEKPCETSTMPVSHADIFPTVIAAAGGDSAKYGKTFFEIDDPNRIRYYCMTTVDGSGAVNEVDEIVEFKIDGPMSDFDNWELTGRRWYCCSDK